MGSDFSKIIKKAKKQKPRKVKAPPYEVPEWFKKIKPGSHGNTTNQKKAWRVVSEYVRQRDFKLYGGKCVSCPNIIPSWQEGDAGHFKPWGSCNGLFKYNVKQIALQCQFCNRYRSGIEGGHAFGEELKRRYGADFLEWKDEENLRHRGKKIEDYMLVEMCEKLLANNVSVV